MNQDPAVWARAIGLLYGLGIIAAMYAVIAIGRIWMYSKQAAEEAVKTRVLLEKQLECMNDSEPAS